MKLEKISDWFWDIAKYVVTAIISIYYQLNTAKNDNNWLNLRTIACGVWWHHGVCGKQIRNA